METYLEAGAVFTNATCGACVGTHLGAWEKAKFASPHHHETLLEGWVHSHQKYTWLLPLL